MNSILRPSLFDVTELVHLVAQHLSQHEIFQCMQVSKQFALQFEPTLWEHLDFSKNVPLSAKASYRNLSHIRSITMGAFVLIENLKILTRGLQRPAEAPRPTESSSKGDSTFCTSSPILASKLTIPSLSQCTNLRRISIISVSFWDHEAWAGFLTLLLCNPGLQSIDMPAAIFAASCSDMRQFLEAISRLVCLEGISLLGKMKMVSIESTLSLLRTCLMLPRLSRLKVEYCSYWTESEQTIFIRHVPRILDEALAARKKMATDGAVVHRIRELVLPFASKGRSITSLPAILRSELLALESFTIPEINEFDLQESLDVLGNVVHQHCTQVQHLVIPERRHRSDHNSVERTVIKECAGGIRSIRGTNIHDLVIRPDNERILWTAVKYHCETLEEIEFLGCRGILSIDILNALMSCTKLRRFWVEPKYRCRASLELSDVAWSNDWRCLGMKELYLVLHRSVLLSRPQSKKCMESAAIRNEENTRVIAGAQRLYEQIGRLTELEVLRLDSGQGMLFVQDYDTEGFSWDLTLSRGYLRKLSGLKKLRKLSLMEDFYSRMGQAEVEFIDAEWPRLELIEFKWKLSRISSTPPWRWLKERRPGLRYKEI